MVHLNAGVAGLVAAYVVGNRYGYGSDNFSPYNLSLAVIGTGLLWVGWFGFNGGSALGAGSRAVFAIVATHLAAAVGALTWMAIEWWTRGKPSVLGMISGAVAGLGTITPASGFILPWHALIVGLLAGSICYWACTWLKQKLNYDDSLDVFGIHGVGGALGTLLCGVFAVAALSDAPGTPGTAGLLEGNSGQVLIQLYGIAVTAVVVGRRDLHHPQGDRAHRAVAGIAAERDRRPRRHPARRSAAVSSARSSEQNKSPAVTGRGFSLLRDHQRLAVSVARFRACLHRRVNKQTDGHCGGFTSSQDFVALSENEVARFGAGRRSRTSPTGSAH